MDGLDARGDAERERELGGRHFDDSLYWFFVDYVDADAGVCN